MPLFGTGLDVKEIIAELEPMIYLTEKKEKDRSGLENIISKTSIQLKLRCHTFRG